MADFGVACRGGGGGGADTKNRLPSSTVKRPRRDFADDVPPAQAANGSATGGPGVVPAVGHEVGGHGADCGGNRDRCGEADGVGETANLERVTSSTEGVQAHLFTGVETMRAIVRAQSEKLQRGTTSEQYISFKPVTEKDLEDIDREIQKAVRKTYYKDAKELIVKPMPSGWHERAHIMMFMEVHLKSVGMGIHRDVVPTGTQTFHSIDGGSSKEGDSGLKPRSARPAPNAWPTIVFEAGFSETLRHLRTSAHWWLVNSMGEVKIVIIIEVQVPELKLIIEKCELLEEPGGRVTRARPGRQPRCTQEVEVEIGPPSRVMGCPLILEFEKVFLRPPQPPREADIQFDEPDLFFWAQAVFFHLNITDLILLHVSILSHCLIRLSLFWLVSGKG